ncbi:hypothetical protein [uncultured Oscillibacter sp.]|uniref:hypothetical protein n=1 Tax=uncultured Oscillibacter sp. TaxID=876091 RepID=UPI001F8F4091|nr:hypothetical protein [uncultured Oscillibacter sp.]HJB76056.1 hypothetical protein [Candidatus Oscillibacter avistercoris]
MEQEHRRITISPSREMALELAAAKDGHYADSTQGEMLRDLIIRGLRAWKAQPGQSGEAM